MLVKRLPFPKAPWERTVQLGIQQTLSVVWLVGCCWKKNDNDMKQNSNFNDWKFDYIIQWGTKVGKRSSVRIQSKRLRPLVCTRGKVYLMPFPVANPVGRDPLYFLNSVDPIFSHWFPCRDARHDLFTYTAACCICTKYTDVCVYSSVLNKSDITFKMIKWTGHTVCVGYLWGISRENQPESLTRVRPMTVRSPVGCADYRDT